MLQSIFAGISEERECFKLEKEKLQMELADAGSAVQELKKSQSVSDEKMKGLEAANRDLHGQLAGSQKELSQVKQESKENLQTVARKAKDFAKASFKKCLAQVRCLYPEAELDPSIIHFDHEVRCGKIVKARADKSGYDIIAPASPDSP